MNESIKKIPSLFFKHFIEVQSSMKQQWKSADQSLTWRVHKAGKSSIMFNFSDEMP